MATACITPDLAAAVLPLTMTCNGNYNEYRLGQVQGTKTWTTDTGMQVTITRFDGTRVQGTMTGTFEMPSVPGDPPVALENGKFDILLTFGG